MFTPPPSPLPFAQRPPLESAPSSSSSLTVPSPSPSPSPSPPPTPSRSSSHQHIPSCSTHHAKLKTARRTRWTILLVPAVLILITASTRYLSHPAALDVFSGYRPSDYDSWADSLTDWKFHEHRTGHQRREPEPQQGQQVSSFSASIAASVPSAALSGSLSASVVSSGSTPTSTTVVANVPTVPAQTPVLPTPFPQPFDNLEQNFSTQGCQAFFLNMLQAEDFRSCRPFSLLLQNSYAFSEAQENVTAMNAIIWGTCNTTIDEETCAANMASYLGQLKSNCSKEISNNFQAVTDAVTGLEAYTLMRTAACQTDATANTYCFIDAIRNTNPSDLYFYNLPLGYKVSNSSTPTCDACTKTLLGLYDQARGNLTALQQNYESAAQFAQKTCGSDYVALVNGAKQFRGTARGDTAGVALLSVAVVMSLL